MTWRGIAFLAILGTANILVRTASYGAGVGTDSIAFLSTALNILAGEAWFADRIVAPRPGKYRDLPHEMEWIEADAHIVWFREFHNQVYYGYDLMDVRILPVVEPVAELADGVVFRVTAAGPFDPFDAKMNRARKQRYVQGLIKRAGEQVVHADSTWPISTWGVEQADERVVRAGWDVDRNGRKLTYRKKPCTPADAETWFLLQVVPADPADLSANRQPHGFDHLDFHFQMHGGVRLDDQCVVTAQLPDYPISRIYIGRWISGGDRTFWDVDFRKPVDTGRPRHTRAIGLCGVRDWMFAGYVTNGASMLTVVQVIPTLRVSTLSAKERSDDHGRVYNSPLLSNRQSDACCAQPSASGLIPP